MMKQRISLVALALVAICGLAGDAFGQRGEYIQIWPPPPGPSEEEIERERRAKQSAVGVRLVGGGFWIPEAEESNRTEVAGFFGVAARFTKGLIHEFAFEAEVMGGATGAASFDGVTVGEVQGDLSRTSRFARFQFAGVARFGHTVQAIARFGLGLQVSSYDSEFLVGGIPADGPDDALRYHGILNLGFGLDTRLTPNMIAGVTTTASQGDGTLQSLGVGLHLSYAWTP